VSDDAFVPDVELWDAWRPEVAAERLAGIDVPWYIAAGWALDLFRGGQTREHEDLEVAVPQERFAEVRRALADLDVFVPVGEGLVRPLDHLTAEELAETHQTWFREPSTERWRLDVFREPSQGETWICRRDTRVRRPFAEVIRRTPDGIPYGAPEIVLLYKAKHAAREKDQADFTAVQPLLSPAQRAWLAEALAVVQPGHRWLDALDQPRR
jgi:Aminoglycoside-2''-adenylyltransferase